MQLSTLIRGGGLAVALIAASNVATAQQKVEVTVGLASTSFATVAPRIAKEMGLYDKYGLDVKFTVMDSASAAVTALISKSINAAVAGPGEVVAAQARGQKVVAVANAYRGFSGALVLSKTVTDKLNISPTAPVMDRVKALDGLLIASPSATGAYTVTFKLAGDAVGANIRFTYMAQPAMVAAFESGAIQGYVGGAPFWAVPVLKGTGIVWINGPKGELPAAYIPASISSVQLMRDYAEANPQVVKGFAAVAADLGKAIVERPAEVKAALAKLYPDIKPDALDLLFATESEAWLGKPMTKEDMINDIAYIKKSGVTLPNIDTIDPATLIFN